MAARPYQLHARKEIVTVENIDRPVTSFSTLEAAEEEAALWAKAGFAVEVIDTSKGETPTIATEPAGDADDETDGDADPLDPDDQQAAGF